LYQGVEVADGAFLGPHVCFTNDLRPRAIHPDGTPRDAAGWTVTPTRIGFGASIGANSTLRAGVQIGDWAMVGAGSVVTKDVPPFALVYGNPARLRGVVAPSGEVVAATYRAGNYTTKDGALSFTVPG
jgi:UDP-2-acetamido-3-amino-2,3-dideoxy-glucuronate N-acetyltransferase